MPEKPFLYTIGHSNRTFDEFVRILKKFGVEVLADVRRFPGSKFEHFKKEHLERFLPENGIEYVWIEDLGGYRKKVLESSPNIAIESEGFRNYADYMLTEDFRKNIGKLPGIANKRRTCIMCAEKLYWKCHRVMISDYLSTVLGFEVLHIIEADEVRRHKLGKYARRVDGGLVYDINPRN